MCRFFTSMIFVMTLLGTDAVCAMQSFRYPLPELLGSRKIGETESFKKKIGVFRNVSTVRIEVKGSASYGEETTFGRRGESIPVQPGAYFQLIPECFPSYESLQLESGPAVTLPEGDFHLKHYFLKKKKKSSFLAEGEGGFTLSFHLIKMKEWHPEKREQLRESSATIVEATFIVEAEERVGDVKTREVDSFRLPVVFSAGHVNFAWGYQDNGFLIDADGKVFLYDNKCRGPRYRTGNEPLTDEFMRDSFSMTKFVKKIGPKQFRKMKKLISDAAKGTVSRHHTGYDAGSLGFTAYLYDKQKGRYTTVNLGSSGDFATINNSPAAVTLKEWLLQVRQEVRRIQERE